MSKTVKESIQFFDGRLVIDEKHISPSVFTSGAEVLERQGYTACGEFLRGIAEIVSEHRSDRLKAKGPSIVRVIDIAVSQGRILSDMLSVNQLFVEVLKASALHTVVAEQRVIEAMGTSEDIKMASGEYKGPVRSYDQNLERAMPWLKFEARSGLGNNLIFSDGADFEIEGKWNP